LKKLWADVNDIGKEIDKLKKDIEKILSEQKEIVGSTQQDANISLITIELQKNIAKIMERIKSILEELELAIMKQENNNRGTVEDISNPPQTIHA
jgi:hypothetical protein